MEPSVQNDKAEGEESMEEILHSIKKIISEDTDGADAKKEKKTNGKAAVVEEEAKEVPGSDVLELTEVVEEPKVAKAEKPKAESKDVLSQIDAAVGPAGAAKEAVPAPAAAKPQPKPAVLAPSSAPGDPMLSDDAVAAVSASVDKLKKSAEPPPVITTPFPSFGSGSLEAMVAEMLKPMIKDWLDRNLPDMVERIVEQEIKRITK